MTLGPERHPDPVLRRPRAIAAPRVRSALYPVGVGRCGQSDAVGGSAEVSAAIHARNGAAPPTTSISKSAGFS